MRVVVADKRVEQHAIEELRQVQSGWPHCFSHKRKAIDQRGATLVLILVFRRDAQRLAEILLMHTARPVVGPPYAIVTFDEQVRTPFNPANISRRSIEADGLSECEAETFVVNAIFDAPDGWLEDVRARSTV